MLRTATSDDVSRLTALYNESLTFAKRVGHIDWPDPFTYEAVEELIESRCLYCIGGEPIDAAVKVSVVPDERIWPDVETDAVYLAKLATADRVRGQGYVRRVLLPVIIKQWDAKLLRLDCLENNRRLKSFYEHSGFQNRGEATFYSLKQGRDITVTRYELRVG